MDLVLELKNNASKLLLAVMESRGDSENAERILYNMNPRQLVDVACKAYHQKLVGGEEAANPKEVASWPQHLHFVTPVGAAQQRIGRPDETAASGRSQR